MLEGLDLKDIPGKKKRAKAKKAFERFVEEGGFNEVDSRRLVRAGRRDALARWRGIREAYPALLPKDIKKMQRAEDARKRREARAAYRLNGVSHCGRLLVSHSWRVLKMGDSDEAVWKRKLSFVPVVHVGKFGKDNLAKLQLLQENMVRVFRLRGGASSSKKTGTHQKGVSLGYSVSPGGAPPKNPRERSAHYSGTVQMRKHCTAEMQALQGEVVNVLTAIIEEAYGHVVWYKALKEAFKNVPKTRRLPTTVPASGIWWNWNVTKSEVHIDWNTVMPCFVLTPHNYKGAELLIGDSNRKIPMTAGRVVGGSWQRFPHCNGKLWGDERYSFVVYYDWRMLGESYWLRY